MCLRVNDRRRDGVFSTNVSGDPSTWMTGTSPVKTPSTLEAGEQF